MEGYRIRNWEKWQTYRSDRSQPPWIKLYRNLLRDIDWIMLTDAQRGQLVAMWLLAADHNGVIPASPKVIHKLCHLESEPDLKFFLDKGFIIDANVTPERRQDDAPDKTRLDKTRLEVDTQPVDKSNGKNNPAWWASQAGIIAKAKSLGIKSRPGESWQDLKGRVEQRLTELT